MPNFDVSVTPDAAFELVAGLAPVRGGELVVLGSANTFEVVPPHAVSKGADYNWVYPAVCGRSRPTSDGASVDLRARIRVNWGAAPMALASTVAHLGGTIIADLVELPSDIRWARREARRILTLVAPALVPVQVSRGRGPYRHARARGKAGS